jgi:hypothetical protein
MKSVSIREFQMKANEYLLTLPILLTRYGVPVAKVTAVEYEIKGVSAEDSNNVDRPVPGNSFEELKGQFDYRKEPEITHDCFIKFCKAPGTHDIEYENPETLKEERNWICDKHLSEMEKNGVEIIVH